MSIFDFFKRKQPASMSNPEVERLFANAVVIGAPDSATGVRAEKDHITRLCGERGKDWKIQGQSLVERNGKPYDEIVVTLSNGETRTFYFDISSFFGK